MIMAFAVISKGVTGPDSNRLLGYGLTGHTTANARIDPCLGYRPLAASYLRFTHAAGDMNY